MMIYNIGLIGLGTMGSALARNFASHGYKVAVYNRTAEKTDEFIAKYSKSSGQFGGFYDLENFVKNLEKPRKIILMVSAGSAVDQTIEALMPLLEKDDIILDGGNSHFKDTEKRLEKLAAHEVRFLGVGISGGEKGALEGPSIMPGGSEDAWKECQPMLEKIAARDFSDRPCVAYMGAGGAGHYVKMVHNGIEYGIMQLIAEAYGLMKSIGKNPIGLSNLEIAKVFEKWNQGKLSSYLIEITSKVLQKNDLVDSILDVAGQKGTGIWTSVEALEKGIPVNTILEATFARSISAQKNLRLRLASKFAQQFPRVKEPLKNAGTKLNIDLLEDALLAAIFMTYAQGFSMLNETNLSNRSEIARIWQGGCIIRARMLEKIQGIFQQPGRAQPIENLLETFNKTFDDSDLLINSLEKLVILAIETHQPIPAFSSTLEYFKAMTSAQLTTNLIQGLRDYFGAHGFYRIGEQEISHGDWEE